MKKLAIALLSLLNALGLAIWLLGPVNELLQHRFELTLSFNLSSVLFVLAVFGLWVWAWSLVIRRAHRKELLTRSRKGRR